MTTIHIDFHEGSSTAPTPWSYNSFTSVGVGTLSADLKDDSNVSTGYSLSVINAFTAASGVASSATSGAGGWPDTVFDYYFAVGGGETPAKLRLGNLTDGSSYTIEAAGHQGVHASRDTNITVAGTTTLYDQTGTSTPSAPISFSGTVSGTSLDIDAALVDTFGYLNGLKITITPPSNTTINVDIPADIDLEWGTTHELAVTHDGGTTTLAGVTLSAPTGWETVSFSTIPDTGTTESFYEYSQSDVTVGNFTAQVGDTLAFTSSTGLTIDGSSIPVVSPAATVTGSYKWWDASLSTWTPVSSYTITNLGVFGGGDTTVMIQEMISDMISEMVN